MRVLKGVLACTQFSSFNFFNFRWKSSLGGRQVGVVSASAPVCRLFELGASEVVGKTACAREALSFVCLWAEAVHLG